MSNVSLANNILNFLKQVCVEDIVLCAGARNSPFLHILDQLKQRENPDFNIYNHFEERSASFFCLGKSLKTSKPTAIITTSGTAAAELLPACIEAFYTSVPLILITADRPPSYRGTGAPQTIEQVGIFSSYAKTFDITGECSVSEIQNHFKIELQNKLPIHLNICFDEPLIDDPQFLVNLDSKITTYPPPNIFESKTDLGNGNFLRNQFIEFLKTNSNPLILVSGLHFYEQQFVLNFLKKFNGPVYVEATSGLKFSTTNQIQCGEIFLKKCFEKKYFNSVIRIGGIPTSRIWRDLESSLSNIPVASISNRSWSGLSRNSIVIENYEFLNLINDFVGNYSNEILFADKKLRSLQDQCVHQYQQSEQSLIHGISKVVGTNPLYLGNSLPIREWDSFSTDQLYSNDSLKNKNATNCSFEIKDITANRGANGIDGQISTYFGWAEKFNLSYALFGDLTALYDLPAPWILSQLRQTSSQFNIFIMNNHGGMIFDKMFKKEIYLNRHPFNFENWAKMWNLNYLTFNSAKDLINQNTLMLNSESENSSLNRCHIIELKPSYEETNLVHSLIENLWKTEF